MCISIGHATDILIRDLEIRDLPGFHGIELNSTSHGAITGCKFRGYVDPGGRDFSEAIQIDLAKSSGMFGGFGPYDHTPCEDILVSGCHFGASGTAGTTAWPRGIGSHSATITKWHRRIRISNNSFDGLLQYAVSAYNYEDLPVNGNTFVGCGSGVRLRAVIKSDLEDTKLPDGTQTGESQQMRNIAVTGNTFRDMGDYAHVVECIGETSGTIYNLAITGNAFDNSGTTANGVRFSYVERATIVGNAIANMGNTGISMANSNRVIVADNQLTWGHGYGMTVDTCSAVTLSGNQVSFPGKGGIWLSSCTDVHHRGNFVKGAGRDTNATYYAFRVEGAGSSSISFSGNKARPYGSGNECVHALSCTTSVSLVQRYGNDWRGATWTAGAATPINDSSTSQNTSSADVLT
ncbi:right-handed parallel beta-helix repeat-containing protein [Streptomyces aureus]|uniref:right-handed parallel beta-helix repeat-containing protein n=1 Tax=Streptomyces aureus TaxID=193461 RepID=UPI0031DBAFAD